MTVDTDIFPSRYRGPRRIARGGMGEVYRATDTTLGRAVAIKILAEHYAMDESIRARFTREALAAARLSGHRNSITIYDVGEHNDRPFIVMEYLGGGSLDDVLREQRAQEPERALTWVEQAATALDAAHAQGVVHRDVKPANLLLDRAGNVHVADFGIASAAGLDPLTMTGTVLGSVGYLSPEQATGDRATPASDRYGLAVVAYELLTGRRPFEAESPTVEASAHVRSPVPSVRDVASLPGELDPVFRKALAKDPAERYGSGADLVAALRGALAEGAGATHVLPPKRSAERPRRSRAWAAVVLLFLLLGAASGAAGAYFLSVSRDTAPSPKVRTVVRTVAQPSVEPQAAAPRERTPPPRGDGHSLNDEGFRRMQAGDFAGAVPLLRQAVQQLRGTGPRDPYEAYANYNLGYSLLRVGECDEAIPYLLKADSLEPWRSEPRSALMRAVLCD